MTSTVYELWFFHGEHRIDRQVIAATLDLDDADSAEDLLTRHLMAAVIRNGGDRTTAHEYLLEVWPVGVKGRQPEVRWALPFEGEGW